MELKLNRVSVKPGGIADAGSRDHQTEHQIGHEVTKLPCSGTVQERPAKVGNSPVHETRAAFGCHPK
jgi:hypothetical protein